MYLPYLTLPTYKHRELQSIEIGARRNFPAELFIMHTISLSEASLSLFMDEKHVHNKKWYLPTYLPNNMLCVTSWWFIELDRGAFLTCGHVRI